MGCVAAEHAERIRAKALAMEGFAEMAEVVLVPYDAIGYGKRLKRLGLEIADLGDAVEHDARVKMAAEVAARMKAQDGG